MFLTITWDQSNEVAYQRELDDDEILDCDFFAQEFVENFDLGGLSRGGFVPTGMGDFTVELAEEPKSGVCWTIQSYFIDPQ